MTLDLGAIAAEFVKVQEIGVKADAFLAEWAAAHPEFADDVGTVRAAIAEATSAGNLVPTVAGGLAGALHAIIQRHGEPGKHSAHFG